MKNSSRHKRENQWTTGQAETIRDPEVFAFKVAKDLYPRVRAEIEERGISKQRFADDLLACYYGLGEGEDEGEGTEADLPEIDINHSLVQDALRIAIAQKQAALSREKKNKRPDQAQIEKWEGEIEGLEVLLS